LSAKMNYVVFDYILCSVLRHLIGIELELLSEELFFFDCIVVDLLQKRNIDFDIVDFKNISS